MVTGEDRQSAHDLLVSVDFGTSHTAAVLRRADGVVEPLLFDGAPLLASGVTAVGGPAAEVGIATGRDARHLADTHPAAYEPAPKARVDEGTVLLGHHELDVTDLIAAPLARVAQEAARVAGRMPESVVLTHPVAWGSHRRARLLDAARRAGLGEPTLVSEPVAAGTYFFAHLPHLAVAGAAVLVYDFGGGTFDASVLVRTPEGLRVAGTDGLADAGGIDVDEAILTHLGAVYGPAHPQIWQRLDHPTDATDRRARRRLWDSARSAKEMLSRSPATFVRLPLLDVDAPLGREEFERLARPVLERTVRCCRAALAAAGLSPADLHGVLLVGGSSRIPLAATLLHRAFGVAPTTVEQPELVVAEGGASALAHGPAAPLVPTAPAGPTAATTGWPAAEPSDGITPVAARRRPRRRPLLVSLLVVGLLAGGLAAAWMIGDDGRPGDSAAATPTASATSASPTDPPLPRSPSAALRRFGDRWLTGTSVCKPALASFPFPDPALGRSLVEAFACEPLVDKAEGGRVYLARFVTTTERNRFLELNYLKADLIKQERPVGAFLHIVWIDSRGTNGWCLGWFESASGVRPERSREIFKKVEF